MERRFGRRFLARAAVAAAGAGLALGGMASPVDAAKPTTKACWGTFMSQSTRDLTQYYHFFATQTPDNPYYNPENRPGVWAVGNSQWPGIVGLAQEAQLPGDMVGFGDDVQYGLAGNWPALTFYECEGT